MLLKIPFSPCTIFLEVVSYKFQYRTYWNEQDNLVIELPCLFILVDSGRLKHAKPSRTSKGAEACPFCKRERREGPGSSGRGYPDGNDHLQIRDAA